jgi:chlorobactene glucosyltransferase
MEIIILFSVITLSFCFLTGLLNIVAGPFLYKTYPLNKTPLVSVCIPARNEEQHIRACLESITAQDYPYLEILVLDDRSADDTQKQVLDFSAGQKNIRLLRGEALPDGWLGKNWACWQLAQQAKGEILVFTDADTWHHPAAVTKTVAWMARYQLGMLSAFPQQITRTFAEKLIVPVIDIILYVFLPLWAVYHIRWPAFSAANGQWIAFTRRTYQHSGGHKAVKREIVEDVQLSRLVKKNRIRTLTAAGTGIVFCRMYSNLSQIWQGLTKIMYGIAANNALILLLFLLIATLIFLMPYIYFIAFPKSMGSLLLLPLLLLFRLVLAIRYRHPLLISVFLLPFSIFSGMIIAINSLYQAKYGKFIWKDREIKL